MYGWRAAQARKRRIPLAQAREEPLRRQESSRNPFENKPVSWLHLTREQSQFLREQTDEPLAVVHPSYFLDAKYGYRGRPGQPLAKGKIDPFEELEKIVALARGRRVIAFVDPYDREDSAEFIESLAKTAKCVVLAPTWRSWITPFIPLEKDRKTEADFLERHLTDNFGEVADRNHAWRQMADFLKNHGISRMECAGVSAVTPKSRGPNEWIESIEQRILRKRVAREKGLAPVGRTVTGHCLPTLRKRLGAHGINVFLLPNHMFPQQEKYLRGK